MKIHPPQRAETADRAAQSSRNRKYQSSVPTTRRAYFKLDEPLP
ncbi:hypothetical protein FG297_22650 [Vibrio alginolyticus]|nr:hypothetical protein [Vibrio alginolyticus]EHA1137175.1 hypothetical protein [Vibrio alginolyticus]